jgi:hypothetical protein
MTLSLTRRHFVAGLSPKAMLRASLLGLPWAIFFCPLRVERMSKRAFRPEALTDP